MATGYSSKFIHAVSTADKVKLGVKFGLICIQKDIPVADQKCPYREKQHAPSHPLLARGALAAGAARRFSQSVHHRPR